jgi:hypothetical protein
LQKNNEAKIFINLEIKEHKIEKLEVNRFWPKQIIFAKAPIELLLKIKNIEK